jgi:alpha-galactosidase
MQDELGLAVQVWTAPTWIGSSADTFEDVADERAKWPEGDYSRSLDPRSPKARAHIKKRFAHLAKKWGVDGYYVDFLDTAYNRNDAQHEKDPALFGAGMSEFLEACYEGFSQGEDVPIAEYRVPFANLMTKHHANVFSTTYSDYKFNRNRLLAIMHRPFNDGVLSRCDPLVWSDEQFGDREFITKTLSAVMLCGPPGISMDLTKMKDDRREQLKRWFAFYKKHSDALINGEFRPFGEEYHSPEMMVCNGKTSYAWISRWETGSVPLPEGTEHAFFFINIPRDESFIARFNVASIQGLVPGRYRAQWFDNALESHEGSFEITIEAPPEGVGDKILSPREKWDFPPDDYRIGLHVKRGGYLELELIEAAQ